MQTHCTLNLKSLHFAPYLESQNRQMIFNRNVVYVVFVIVATQKVERNRKIILRSSNKRIIPVFLACIRCGTVGCRIECRAVHYWVPFSSLHLLRKRKKHFFNLIKCVATSFLLVNISLGRG